jgi:hypothetical protein
MKYNNILYLILIIIFIIYYKYPKFNQKIHYKYEDIEDKLNTGDIILFSCNTIISKCIKSFSQSIFTHCGIVIKLYNKLFLLECDIDDEYDYITSSYKKGVRLVSLKKKINDFANDIFAFRKLTGNKINKNKLINIIKKTYYYKFEFNILCLLLNYYGINFLKKDNTMMCSEYISYIYYKTGIIKYNNFSKCLPKFFCKNNITTSKFNFDKITFFKK